MNAIWTACLLMAWAAQPVETSSTPTTRLYVRTIPPGARVVLDGKDLGTTDGLFLVPPGMGRLNITLDGQQPEIRQVEISEGRITRIEIQLTPSPQSTNAAATSPGPDASVAGMAAALQDPRIADALQGARAKAKQIGAMNNMRQILLALILYAENHQGQWPNELNELKAVTPDFDKLLDNPRTGLNPGFSYVKPAKLYDPAKTPVLWEATSTGSRDLEAAIGYADGHIEAGRPGAAQVASDTPLDVGGMAGIEVGGGGVELPTVIDLTPGRTDRQPTSTEPPSEIEKALNSKIRLDFQEVPLEQVAAFLREQGNVNISLDRKALDAMDMGPNTPVTFKASGITLRSVLTLLLRDVDLAWTLRDKTLEITSYEALEKRIPPRVYPVSDLTSNSAGLASLIASLLDPESWDVVGGPASIVADRAQGKEALVVSQTEQTHRQVASFLAVLRDVARQPADKLPVALSDNGWWRQTPETDAVRKALEQKLTCEFRETTLTEFLQFLQSNTQIPMLLDRRSIDEAGVPADAPLTATFEDVALQDILTMVLKDVDLTYTVTDDVLLVTTPDFESYQLTWAIYPIGDLVTAGRSAEALIQMLTTTVAPESWEAVGGPGAVRGIRGVTQALVITQSCDVHRQIAALLAQLRRP